MPPKKKIRDNDSYLKLGFTVIKSDGKGKRKCVLCCIVLALTSLKPTKLKKHHPNLFNRDVDLFKQEAEH